MSHRPGFFDDEGGDGRRPGGGGAGQSQAAAAKGDKDKGLPTGGKGEQQQSSGWFGGIFGKFGKPKNQMILPDDKNPTVSWRLVGHGKFFLTRKPRPTLRHFLRIEI